MEPAPDSAAVLPSRLFTARKRVVLLNAIKSGQTIKAACAVAGVHQATFYDHINVDDEFRSAVERAKGVAESRLVEAVTKSGHTGETVVTPGGQVTIKPGDWRAAAWLLEHHPNTRERYAAISKNQISGDPDNPTPVAVDVAGDEMTTVERMAAVVSVLQRARVMPLPGPGDTVIDVTPPEANGATESPDG